MPKLRFTPAPNQDSSENEVDPAPVEVEIQPGQTIFDLGWQKQVGIASACVGKGTCGLCRIKILSGEDQLSPYNSVEEKHLGNTYFLTKIRLSCQCEITSDATEISVAVVAKKQRSKSR